MGCLLPSSRSKTTTDMFGNHLTTHPLNQSPKPMLSPFQPPPPDPPTHPRAPPCRRRRWPWQGRGRRRGRAPRWRKTPGGGPIPSGGGGGGGNGGGVFLRGNGACVRGRVGSDLKQKQKQHHHTHVGHTAHTKQNTHNHTQTHTHTHTKKKTRLAEVEELADGRVRVGEKQGGQLVVVRLGGALEVHQLGEQHLFFV